MISPVCNQPLLLAEGELRVLVAADLHLGLEHELWLGGVSIPSQTERILERLMKQLSEVKPDRLLLLGDVKHNVPRTSWQERREVPEFLKALCEAVKVEIVPGNHDTGIADMAPLGVRVRPSSGFVLDGVGYFHGHTWPDPALLRAEVLVAAHLHPAVRLKDPLGCTFTRRVWARAPLQPEAMQKQYGFSSAAQMIITPAFNDLCGGLPLNEPENETRGPVLSLADLDRARLYLLDGTDLGELREIKESQNGLNRKNR